MVHPTWGQRKVSTGQKILVFDTENESRRSIVKLLEEDGFDVVATGDGRAAIELAAIEPVYMAVVELNESNLDGLEISTRVKRRAQFVPVVFLSTAKSASAFGMPMVS